MKIPKNIKINAHNIDVKILPTQDIDNTGMFDSFYYGIRLRGSDTPETKQSEAFLHEIIEAIIHINNISMDHTHLTVLSEQIFAVIRNNNLSFNQP
jgi:hypothetical protein